jgi:2-polyprenyl-6-methoxyphenol hydroxylase-like FAD-dependent oxidoreductase
MRNAVADKLYDDKVFLIGDSAHQFPPSGGYGLNTGIFDTMNIFWRIVLMLKGNLNVKQIIEIKKSFERECTINSNVMN